MSIPAGILREHTHKTATKRPREATPARLRDLQPLAPGALLQRAALAPESLRPAEVVRMQQTLGNRAVGGLLSRSSSQRPLIQAKLTVNAPGDKYEQEADRVAEQVMRMPAVQREDLEDEDEEPEVMTKREPAHAAGGAFEAGEEFEQQLRASRGQGQPLPPTLREEFEAKFGADFSGVRVHADAQSDALNRSIQAKAFTTGQDIFFKQNEYQPDSMSGKRLLAHELAHTLQQMPKAQSGVPYPKAPSAAIGTTRLLPWDQAVESRSHLASCAQSCKSNFLTAPKRVVQRVLDDKQYKIAKQKGGYTGVKGGKLIGVASLMRKYNGYLREKNWPMARLALVGLKSALKSEHKEIRPKLLESRQGYFDYFIKEWLDEVKREKANLKNADTREKAAEEAYGSYQEQKDTEAVLEHLNAIAGNILETMQEHEGLLGAHERNEDTIGVLKSITSVVENINASMKAIQNDDTRSDFFKTYYQKKAIELLTKLKYYFGLFNTSGLADYRRG